jgi:hypothetical protein
MATPTILIVPDRYKSGVLYSQLPESGAVDFDVTRATTAFRTNASGVLESVASGVPRLDYPAAGGCPSLLVEPAATNLLLRSEEFDNAYWNKLNVTVSGNAAVAPNNATTADEIIENAATGFFYIDQPTFAATADIRYSWSIHVKKTNRRYFQVTATRTSTVFGSFILDLDTGLIAATSNSGNSARFDGIQVTSVGGYYRVSGAASRNSSGALDFYFGFSDVATIASDNRGFTSFTSAGGSAGIVWGAQLETGSVATSYIPTVAATATRNADVISKTGVSGFIGQTEGIVYAEFSNTLLASYAQSVLISLRGDANNELFIRKEAASNTYTARWRGNSINIYTITGINVLNGINKIAFAYKSGESALYLNGSLINSSTATGAFNITIGDVSLGSIGGTTIFNDRIRAAAIYPTRLSNAELSALTTL